MAGRWASQPASNGWKEKRNDCFSFLLPTFFISSFHRTSFLIASLVFCDHHELSNSHEWEVMLSCDLFRWIDSARLERSWSWSLKQFRATGPICRTERWEASFEWASEIFSKSWARNISSHLIKSNWGGFFRLEIDEFQASYVGDGFWGCNEIIM